ncbi:MAG: hypothetical protein M1829_001107 [Trizodia sp. TS-e1964]|nr:MAG: hypothetical protein M1829_001107 [Trizodia sp. TS-e1964]
MDSSNEVRILPPTTPPSLRILMSSPSQTISPTPALSACPPLERSVSTASSASTISRSSTEPFIRPRRGYIRPHATNFADSARSRESVMSLGSIAHLQYYFARTGLLDGKGGQLAGKPRKTSNNTFSGGKSPGTSVFGTPSELLLSPFSSSDRQRDSAYTSMRSSPDLMTPFDSLSSNGSMMVESPIEEELEGFTSDDDQETSIMLPPTVSTYNYRIKHVEPPPNLETLRASLSSALIEAKQALNEASDEEENNLQANKQPELNTEGNQVPDTLYTVPLSATSSSQKSEGWFEIQGMHLLDVITLAIRAAKLYYTAHDNTARISALKSERKIREELLNVLDVLKRMASRKFAGGLRTEERTTIADWVLGVQNLLQQENDLERREVQELSSRRWLKGEGWTEDETGRDRELNFLRYFDPCPDSLPPWILPLANSELPTPFLLSMQSGLRLVRLHNAMVHKSRRPFGQIPVFHTDTQKPYRCAENLRFWIKAAEIRWEILLQVDVMAVVQGNKPEAWRSFDSEIKRWCTKVREEIAEEVQEKRLSISNLDETDSKSNDNRVPTPT